MFIVIGCHRSGTSLVAKSLAKCNIHMGDNLLPPNRWNPDGYFEDAVVVNFNDTILKKNGATWASPPKTLKYSSEDVEWVKNLIDERRRKYGDMWGIKDPRLAIVWDVWEEAIKEKKVNPKIIWAIRDPIGTIRSILKREIYMAFYIISRINYYISRAGKQDISLVRVVKNEIPWPAFWDLIEYNKMTTLNDFMNEAVNIISDKIIDWAVDLWTEYNLRCLDISRRSKVEKVCFCKNIDAEIKDVLRNWGVQCEDKFSNDNIMEKQVNIWSAMDLWENIKKK